MSPALTLERPRHKLDRFTYPHGGFEVGRKRAQLLGIGSYDLVILSDLEGPHLKGDTAIESLKRIWPGQIGGVDRAALMHKHVNEWLHSEAGYDDWAEVGRNIVLSMPLFVVKGITNADIEEKARTSHFVKGADIWCQDVLANNGAMIGVTTAWEKPHRALTIGTMGFTDLIGTEFDIEETRKKFEEYGERDSVTEATELYIDECEELLSYAYEQNIGAEERENRLQNLRSRIGAYYKDTLGVSLDPQERIRKQKANEYKSPFDDMIENSMVAGSVGKREVAIGVWSVSNPGALVVAIGDGTNDSGMLLQIPHSIGLNSEHAAAAATFGLITPTMEVMPTLTEIMQIMPLENDEDVWEIIRIANHTAEFENAGAVVHRGGRIFDGTGPNKPVYYLEQAHRWQKQQRGPNGSALI